MMHSNLNGLGLAGACVRMATAALILSGIPACDDSPVPPPGSCRVEGTVYSDGTANIPAADGCNTCSCTNGVFACTLRACPVARACGARAGNTCAANEYCAYVEGEYCGGADAEAICKPRPSACDAIYAPVCGCDGKTYSSACDAALAGAGVMQAGACANGGRSCSVGGIDYPDGTGSIRAPDGCNTCSCADGSLLCTLRACPVARACGARAGNTCAANEYCAYVEGEYCGGADAEAACQIRPAACDDIYAPACGCDGKTYSNACNAAQAGTGVLHAGPCS